MTGIKKLVNVTVSILQENSHFAQSRVSKGIFCIKNAKFVSDFSESLYDNRHSKGSKMTILNFFRTTLPIPENFSFDGFRYKICMFHIFVLLLLFLIVLAWTYNVKDFTL